MIVILMEAAPNSAPSASAESKWTDFGSENGILLSKKGRHL